MMYMQLYYYITASNAPSHPQETPKEREGEKNLVQSQYIAGQCGGVHQIPAGVCEPEMWLWHQPPSEPFSAHKGRQVKQ